MNFKKDINDYIKGELNYFDINFSSSGNTNDDLLKLFTIQKKYIFQFKRTVQISKELQNQIDNKCNHYTEILRLKDMIEKGIDINPNQSSKLLNYHVHDHLVYDWNIYHLHLSLDKREGEFFTKRTKKVLFAFIDKEKALFIDVMKHPPHDNFANKSLLEIIDKNWNDILLEMNGVVGLSHNMNQQERFKMRKYNVNEGGIEVNGKFIFSPGLGQTTSGHSAGEVMKLNELNRWLKKNEQAITENQDSVDKMFIRIHGLQNKPKYKIMFTELGPEIWDKNTNICLVKYREVINIEKNTKR